MKSMKKVLGLGIALSLGTAGAFAQTNIDTVANEQSAANKDARESQKKIDGISDETQKLLEDYTNTLTKIENMRTYNSQLEKYIKSQGEEKISMAHQIKQVGETNQGIVPLMLKMLESLEQFVALDTPFLPEERANRIKELKGLIDRADITTSEKYRRVLEGYQVENEYGRTIEAYRGKLERNGKEMTVDYLRIGRVSFVYQTLDGNEQAYWDNAKKEWINLPSSYSKEIENGLKIARQQMAPDLIKVPVPGPVRL
jgi:septal ring factor EnvC (AmiA/AmiB activator)